MTYTEIAADSGRTLFLACDECGALVLPTFRATHDSWHLSVDDLVHGLIEGTDDVVRWPSLGRPVDLQLLVDRIHEKAKARR